MSEQYYIIGIFPSLLLAKEAIREMRLSGLNIGNVSIIGGEHHSETILTAGKLAPFGAELLSKGICRDSVRVYENAVKGGRFLLIFHGSDEDVFKARPILIQTKAVETAFHAQRASVSP